MSKGLFSRLLQDDPSTISLEDLRKAAQLAVQVEFTTIPAYLTALYSIKEPNSFAYQTLRSVVMEEMFHVNQAANILVALGGKPKFTGEGITPTYPNFLPHANSKTTPQVGLCRASPQLFLSMFAAIETPAEAGAPSQPNNYDSIAQLYGALSAGIDSYEGDPFTDAALVGRQRLDIYLGKFGGNIIEVVDKDSAQKAITEIIEQGEGFVPVDAPWAPQEEFGSYNHYGQRTDGTYGPILGTPYEMSHFFKFRKVGLDAANFPSTYPIMSNPKIGQYTNPEAISMANAFNKAYSAMLDALEKSFEPEAKGAADPYFEIVLGIMHKILPNLARALMTTPAHENGNSAIGPNAAPTWEYVSQESSDPQCKTDKVKNKLDEAHLKIEKLSNKVGFKTQQLLLAALDGIQTISASLKQQKK